MGDSYNSNAGGKWMCIQVGHRERYAIPAALNRLGLLARLVTDIWVPRNSPWRLCSRTGLVRRLNDRYCSDLPSGLVRSFNLRTVLWEFYAELRSVPQDDRVHARNKRWSVISAKEVARCSSEISHLFCYCYGALSAFEQGRKRNLRLVLGQIDPGPEEDKIVSALVERYTSYKTNYRAGSPAYYNAWRKECVLSDLVVVNSGWSREALIKQGVSESKIRIVPLVYNGGLERSGFKRLYPAGFSRERPLRVLFLGQCILRKGIAEAFDAARQLTDMPVEFTFVGQSDISNLTEMLPAANSKYHPRVTRAECDNFYRDADVFLFPTHSDGFGLTQLEAQSWKLPIIATAFCGEVVEPGITGWVLGSISGMAISNLIKEILADPGVLNRMSGAISPWPYTHETIARMLSE